MGNWFKSGSTRLEMPTPEITYEASTQPRGGGERTEYRVVGVFDEFGHLSAPAVLVIELDDNRRCNKPGDTLWLTRQEAAVVGKRHALVPLIAE